MKIITNFLLKNWGAVLLLSVLLAAFGWVKGKDNKIERLGTVLDSARTDNVRLVSALDAASASASLRRRELDAVRGVLRQAQDDRRVDSVFFAKQLVGMQSVIAQVRAKAKREKETDDALIVELRKGLPPKECYNIFGRVVDCKD
jgi:hypothetical protein